MPPRSWVDSRGLLERETRLRGYRDSSLLWCHEGFCNWWKSARRFDRLAPPCFCRGSRGLGAWTRSRGLGPGVTGEKQLDGGRVVGAVSRSVGTRKDPQLHVKQKKKKHLFRPHWTIKVLISLIRQPTLQSLPLHGALHVNYVSLLPLRAVRGSPQPSGAFNRLHGTHMQGLYRQHKDTIIWMAYHLSVLVTCLNSQSTGLCNDLIPHTTYDRKRREICGARQEHELPRLRLLHFLTAWNKSTS